MDFAIFVACAAAIAVAGPRMVDAVEAVADRTGIGKLWLGAVLLAGATSLPELVATVSAAVMDEPNLALGTVLGSNMFNMTIFGIVIIWRPGTRGSDPAGVATGLVAVALGVIAAVFILVADPAIGAVGLGASLILAVYLLASFFAFRRERARGAAAAPIADSTAASGTGSMRSAAAWLTVTTTVVFITSIFIADAAEGVADSIGISGGVMGVVGLALATSLPEVVTSIAALRRGAMDLMIGNLFGSNIFNAAVLFPADVSFNDGSLLRAADTEQLAPALFGVVMMLLALAVLRSRPASSHVRIRISLRVLGATIVTLYFAGVIVTVVLGVDAG